MLDLGSIPLRSAERDKRHPLIIAGGGSTFNAEPVAPFFDAHGPLATARKPLPAIMGRIEQSRENRRNQGAACCAGLIDIPGVYVPSFLRGPGTGPAAQARWWAGYETVEKAVVDDLDAAPVPAPYPPCPTALSMTG